jgi:beta-xylosidase
MEHIISRYGIEEILQWKFSAWHLPDTPSRLYGFDAEKDFFVFYQKTFLTVKEFDSRICFGLPTTFYLNEHDHSNWYLTLLKWSLEHKCEPDFVSFSFYDVKLTTGRNSSLSTFGFVDSLVLNDTCYKSCYIVKNILENYDKLDGLSYWSLTDLMTEAPLPDALLYGGLGLFTKNGLPKASYYALCILRQLGDTFLAKGDGWFATKTSKDIRIMTYHYKHITALYSMGERFDMTYNNRYALRDPGASA